MSSINQGLKQSFLARCLCTYIYLYLKMFRMQIDPVEMVTDSTKIKWDIERLFLPFV